MRYYQGFRSSSFEPSTVATGTCTGCGKQRKIHVYGRKVHQRYCKTCGRTRGVTNLKAHGRRVH